jgi:hypothetical protein
MLLGLTMSVFRAQAGSTGSGTWVLSYQIVGGSSSGTLTAGAPETRVPSLGELYLICNLRDQLKNVPQELKDVTALVAVSHSKASQAMAVERYLLSEVKSIGKSLKRKYHSEPLSFLNF